MDESELEPLLALDGVAFEMAPGVIVEFMARRTGATPERPHGISYALVLRSKTEASHGCALIMLTAWRRGAGAIGQNAWPMIIGTGRRKTRADRTSSRQRCSCWMISGGR